MAELKQATKTTGRTSTKARLKSVSGKRFKTPTEMLFHGRKGDTPLVIIQFTKEGFVLSDVRDMLSTSELYMESGLVERITGRSVRTVQRLAKETEPVRLNQQQSTVAFQYAQILEHATSVFGNQHLAEDWLSKPSRYLDGNIPLELIDNTLGFQVVEDYLTRVEQGVYQ